MPLPILPLEIVNKILILRPRHPLAQILKPKIRPRHPVADLLYQIFVIIINILNF